MKKLLIAVVTLLILSGAGIGAAQVSGHPITAFLAGQLSRAPKTVAVPQVKQTLTSELPQAELGKDNRNVATPSPSPTAPPPYRPVAGCDPYAIPQSWRRGTFFSHNSNAGSQAASYAGCGGDAAAPSSGSRQRHAAEFDVELLVLDRVRAAHGGDQPRAVDVLQQLDVSVWCLHKPEFFSHLGQRGALYYSADAE